MSRIAKISAMLFLGGISAACSSVKMPDLVDLPEFSEAISGSENLEYPDPAKAPTMPEDMRGSGEWDKAAKDLLRKRDGFDAPPDVDGPLTDQEIEQNIEALKSKVKEYKLDDPVE